MKQVNITQYSEVQVKEIPELKSFTLDKDILYELLESDLNLGVQVVTSVS